MSLLTALQLLANSTPAEQNDALKVFIAVGVVVVIIIALTRKGS